MEINKYYRNGNLVFECRKKQKAFEIISQNPGFLVVEFEASTLVDHNIRYKSVSEVELADEYLVGEYIEDSLEEKLDVNKYANIRKTDSINKLKLI